MVDATNPAHLGITSSATLSDTRDHTELATKHHSGVCPQMQHGISRQPLGNINLVAGLSASPFNLFLSMSFRVSSCRAFLVPFRITWRWLNVQNDVLRTINQICIVVRSTLHQHSRVTGCTRHSKKSCVSLHRLTSRICQICSLLLFGSARRKLAAPLYDAVPTSQSHERACVKLDVVVVVVTKFSDHALQTLVTSHLRHHVVWVFHNAASFLQ